MVGASQSFIIWPFLFEGAIQGLIGALSSITGLDVHPTLTVRLQDALGLDMAGELKFLNIEHLLVLSGVGLLLGVLAALIATKRFMSQSRMMRYILLLLSFSAQAQEPANDPRQTLVNAGKEERSLLKELSEIDQKLSQPQLEKQSLEGQKSDLEIRKQKNQIEADNANQDLMERQIRLKRSRKHFTNFTEVLQGLFWSRKPR